ncbi:Uncharacterised protein [Bordetella pertussis]|nr:Uncharacterised protein [Bordetella pertussis]
MAALQRLAQFGGKGAGRGRRRVGQLAGRQGV